MIPVERMSLARALDLAARIADPEDGADEVPQGDRREAVDVLRCEVVRTAADLARLRAEVVAWRERPDGAQTMQLLDIARAELDELHALVAAQAAILTGVANALRGPPGLLASHSHHDLAERAAEMKRELDEARAALLADAAPCVNGRCEERATRWVNDGWLERLRCDACSESMIAAGATYRDLQKAAALRSATRAETRGDRG